MSGRLVLLLCLLWLIPADAATVQVGLVQESQSNYKQVRLEGRFKISGKRYTSAIVTAKGGFLYIGGKDTGRNMLNLSGVRTILPERVKAWTIDCPARLTASGNRLTVILSMDLEEYTSRAVAAEMPADWPIGALATQAVVSRSFASAAHTRHQTFALCPLTHCQRIASNPANGEARSAAAMTRGVIVTYADKPLLTPFCSTCGGHTMEGKDVGFSSAIIGVKCGPSDFSWCKKSPHFRWTTVITQRERTLIGQTEMSGWSFALASGRKLGWNRVKGGDFKVEPVNGGWRLDGRGLGHGAGLCQWGAKGMAEHGKGWKEIVRWYFPKGKLQHQ